MSTEERLKDYDNIYHFTDAPDKYSFEKNPERIIIRNSALREANADLYLSYLRQHYPASVEREMEQFQKSLSQTREYLMTEARQFFARHAVKAVQSDIVHFEEDAIFTAKILSHSEAEALVDQSSAEPLLQYLMIDMLDHKTKIWIVASELRSMYNENING
ncbi:hypothetical protein PQ465_12360 [Sphingobacterium oryzagri]|uniref:Uncharacterized protein n=1 Tax=Sphingobacterium oryzagri TaxID=3025669 RepID=A0ABY7WBS2_9SPHI|nr:hypothetical protein [Sphingobacterium sp. KACC 22765]WDF67099.1 hypothetical protein PQ465_12360 [Sphingobacterium sp. KACC 22765]